MFYQTNNEKEKLLSKYPSIPRQGYSSYNNSRDNSANRYLPSTTYPGSRDNSGYKSSFSNGNSNNMTNGNYTSVQASLDIEDASDNTNEDKGSKLVIAFLLMLVFQLGNRIFGRLQTYPMHNYPIFMNLLSVFIYIPISFLYIIPMIMYGEQITKEQREIPQYKFAVMGFWDSVAGVMQTFSVNYITSSSTIVLVQQSAIPISMLISKMTLNAKYTTAQYSGATIVMAGIVAVLMPNFFSSTPTASDHQQSNSFEIFWIFVLVLSCVPMCLSSVYKEKALGEVEIDVVYLNGCVALFQFLFAIPICVPSAQIINMSASDIFPNIYGGMKCWMGLNSTDKDNCSSAPYFVTIYLLFNIVYNILTVVILKHGSANILFMASTIIVPLSDVVFSLDFMPGHKPMTYFDLLGLCIIMCGLVIYRFMPQIIQLVRKFTSTAESAEEIEAERAIRQVSMRAEGKQVKFLGLNQMEGIQSLFDSRMIILQKQALTQKSSQQIRGNLFLKLGIPPSPLISMAPQSRRSQNDYSTATQSMRIPQSPHLAQSPLVAQSPLIRSSWKPIGKLSELKIPSRTNSTPKEIVK